MSVFTEKGQQVFCNVGSGTTAIKKYQLVYWSGENEVELMPVTESADEHSKCAGVAIVAYPYELYIAGQGETGHYGERQVTDKTVDVSGLLEGGVTVRRGGQCWVRFEVDENLLADHAVNIGDRVVPGRSTGFVDGSAEAVAPASVVLGDHTKIIGTVESNLYKEPGDLTGEWPAEQWTDNELDVPGAGETSVGYALIRLELT